MKLRPFIESNSDESRRLLAAEIAAAFPESGIAGFYCRKISSGHRFQVMLSMRCQVTRESKTVAIFDSYETLASLLTFCAEQIEACRRRAKRRMAA